MVKQQESPNAIDLFAGAGGFSLGLKQAGWNISASVEVNESASDTYECNHKNTSLLRSDIRQVNFRKFKGIDLIAGGPPCQPFSIAGKQLAHNDERDMIPEFVRAVKEAHPRAFIMENVPGLMSLKNRNYVKWLLKVFEDLGYFVEFKILEASHYGVSQKRRRIFFVGFCDPISYYFPKPTSNSDSQPCTTVRQALQNVPCDAPNNAIVTYARKPVLRPSPWAGMLVNGGGRPIDLDGLSHTIPASAGGNRTHILDFDGVLLQYHTHLLNGGQPRSGVVKGVRRLTVRESARIQTFPDDYKFLGKRTSQYRQVGNAIPPYLAQAIGRSVRQALFNKEIVEAEIRQTDLCEIAV